MVLSAQPWAAVELLGPSSYCAVSEDIFSLPKRGGTVQFKKSMGTMLLKWQIDTCSAEKKMGVQQVTALPKNMASVFAFKPLSPTPPGGPKNSLPAEF